MNERIKLDVSRIERERSSERENLERDFGQWINYRIYHAFFSLSLSYIHTPRRKLIWRWKIENLIDALTFIRFDKRMYKQFNFLNALHTPSIFLSLFDNHNDDICSPSCEMGWNSWSLLIFIHIGYCVVLL